MIAMGCDHVTCGCKDKVWLPYKFKGRDRGLKPHMYCIKCGLIRSISSEKPRRTGFYQNVLCELAGKFHVTKVQIRLISHELDRCGIEDMWGMDATQQDNLFVQSVRKHLNMPEETIRAALRAHA